MKSIGIFISFLLFISCTAMEYSTTDNLIITIKDLEQKNPSSLENSHKDTSLPPLQIPIFVVESFEYIKNCVDATAESQDLNKKDLFKQTLLLSLKKTPSFNNNESATQRFNYLNTFFKCTSALYALHVQNNNIIDEYDKEHKYRYRVYDIRFKDYLDMNTLSIDDFINIGMDLDFFCCNTEMLRLFAHYCFDNDIYSTIISNKAGNDKIKSIKRILKSNALSIANIKTERDGKTFYATDYGIRTLHNIKTIAKKLENEKITKIWLNGNNLISCEIAKICKHFKDVKYFFYKDNNQIKTITEEDLNALSAIENNYLNLTGCPIISFPIEHLANIQSINIQYDLYSGLPDKNKKLRISIKKKIKEIKNSTIKPNFLTYYFCPLLLLLLNALLYVYGFTEHLDLYTKYKYSPPVHTFDDSFIMH